MAPVLLLNAVSGNQLYDDAPPTVIEAEEPAQTEAVDGPESCGKALTVTGTEIVLEQPDVVPVTE